MIVTRRSFLRGSAAIVAATAVVAKADLPRLLTGSTPAAHPNARPARSDWTVGLLGQDGWEIDQPGYQRVALEARELDTLGFAIHTINDRNAVFHFTQTVTVAAFAVWMPGMTRPTHINRHRDFPVVMTPGNTITLVYSDRPVLHVS